MSRRRRVADDDDLEDDDDDEEVAAPVKKKTKKASAGFLDDAAVDEDDEEGGGDDDDEDDEEDANEYVKDGFLVDEDDDDDEPTPKKKKKKDDLEDSDDDDDEDDDDEDSTARRRKKQEFRKKSRLKKLKQTERLADEDLELIREAQGLAPRDIAEPEDDEPREHIRARNEAELRQGLFVDDDADGGGGDRGRAPKGRIRRQGGDLYDEDGMDDFIEDDLHDQDDIRMAERRDDYDGERTGHFSQAELQAAEEIFGTDYLDFMKGGSGTRGDDEEDEVMGRGRYRDRGADVDNMGDDMDDDDSEGSLFDQDDDEEGMDGLTAAQKAEALKLKREKARLSKQQRRAEQQRAKTEKRKAQLRRVFEPVQLIENFCTDRDDKIRQTDAPERLFDWNTPFYGNPAEESSSEEMTEQEREQAEWIVTRIPEILNEYTSVSFSSSSASDPQAEQQRQAILLSVAHALRYMHKDKLEPAFIKRYRKDYVTSPAVREHLAHIMEEDVEWDRLVKARAKVQELLTSISTQADGDAQTGADADRLVELRQHLEQAKQALDDSQARASTLQAELDALSKKGKGGEDDDDDDQLFEDDDEEDEEKEKERVKEKARVASSLRDVQELVTLRTERASQLESQLQLAEAQERALKDKAPMERVMKKTSRKHLWNADDYKQMLESNTSDSREVVDMHGYLNLIQEGNEAIKKKELPILAAGDGKDAKQRRSRRFDRDYYRTCVAEGLRSVCYKFLLAPNRVGIKLEDSTASHGMFDFTRTMPGEESGGPSQWVPPQIPQPPKDFANDLISSGELILLAASGNTAADSSDDPLRGCRYVAALELASEPRVRKHLRKLFRKHAMLTTKPTKKGMEELDAFHDFYGLHLIKNKPVSDHFPMDPAEQLQRKSRLTAAERHEWDVKMRQRQVDSCVQFLNIIKAAQGGFITVHVHLPLLNDNDQNWYKPENKSLSQRSNQDLTSLASALEKVYLPPDGDTGPWNDERKQVVRFALNSFLLPNFEAELRRELREVASRVGVEAAAGNLRALAMEGPFRPDRDEQTGLYYNESRFTNPTGDLPIVGFCASTDQKDASYFAYVSEHGKSEDFLAVPFGQRMDSGKMRESVITFLIRTRPNAVVVGTSGGFESRLLYRKLKHLIEEAKIRWGNRLNQGEDEDDDVFKQRQEDLEALSGRNDFYDEVEWKCDIEIIDDKVAQLYGRSVRSKKEFPDFPTNHKIAIATARYSKNPLSELTYTWSVASDAGIFGTEMLYLNIHPLQQLLPRTMLLREYERTLCDVVAEVGVDINVTCANDHLRGLLMFIPGLGPRKAAYLKQMVTDSSGVVPGRRHLIEDRLMGPIVYSNAAPFLRFQQVEQNQSLHPLDNTRLHPVIYIQHDWAVKIAFDALERENNKAKAIKAVQDAMHNSQQEVVRLLEATEQEWYRSYQSPFKYKEWDPRYKVPAEHWGDEVGGLDLDAFANAIERKGHGRWHSHFEMLLWEFRLPYLDPRKPMEPLDGEQLFKLITNESDQSLRPGKEVTGKVVSNGEFGSRVKLEGDIPAFIPLRNLSDEHVEAPEDIVSVGQVVTAIVTEVKKDHMTVDMSLKMEDFRKNPSSWERPPSLPPFDPFFDRSAASRIEEDNNKKREAHLEALQISMNKPGEGGVKKKKRVVKRACTHPSFRNAKNDEVDKELRSAGETMVGQALIRPSNKQSDSLAIHWVVKEGSIKIIEVTEDEKDSDTAIGNFLKIKDETYGSIDEMLARYIEPMNDFVDELQRHRKFINKSEDDVDEELKKEKKKNPAGIPYAVCWMDVYPGYASLRYIQNVNPRNHNIVITPKGFSWMKSNFLTLDQLINAFKRNPNGIVNKKPSASGSDAPQPKPAAPAPVVAPPSNNSPPKPPASRWGAKPPAPAAPPLSTWQQRPTPPPRPPQAPGWNAGPPPAPAAPMARPTGGWSQQQQPPPPRPPPPRPQGLPPPPSYVQPPSNVPPPPRPPPPPMQQQQQRPPPPQVYGAPPPPPRPPGQPPAFGGAPAGGPPAPIGRGRGRTLPAWMAKQNAD